MNLRCTQCASELDQDGITCSYCGAENVLAPAEMVAIPMEPVLAAPARVSEYPAEIVVPFGAALLDDHHDVEGIGGWLILVAFGLVVSPFVLLANMAGTFWPLLMNAQVRQDLLAHSTLGELVLFDLATNVIFLFMVLALNNLFFKRKRNFPTLMVLYLVLQLAFAVFDLIAVYVLVPTPQLSALSVSVLIRGVVGALIWTPYLLESRRVKATFVN